ncbi:DUF397 domain-containing protein [Actinomadura barringtoniae]|uniref:DUF397 domain-containing protein n=1 Tax=Actinomadura barringtoniae TaxID=1427535 RepID=A0A939PLP2_9ACTN|nr:DUF397 domain-containing protein [Actinomadura barringtoniae]MBO2454378.1 DUF397 domain-containing protein [Actinomadura barringtoniae]
MDDLTWRKATRSSEAGDNCIEVAGRSELVALRDSKEPRGPQLLISRADFGHFLEVIKKS